MKDQEKGYNIDDLIYILDNDLLKGVNKKLSQALKGPSVIILKLTPYVYIVNL